MSKDNLLHFPDDEDDEVEFEDNDDPEQDEDVCPHGCSFDEFCEDCDDEDWP